MSLDLGELVGSLRMDTLPWEQALSKADTTMGTFATKAKADAGTAGRKIGADLGAGVDSALAELAKTLPVTAKGAVDRSSVEFQALSPALRKAVTDAEAQAKFDRLPVEARAAMSAAEAQIAAGATGIEAEAEQAGRDAAKGFSDEFKAKAKEVGTAAGAGLGVAIGIGVADNMSVEAGLNKVAVQLGLGKEDMRVAGEVAGQIYANNFGEDLPQINEAIANVVRNMNMTVRDVDLQPIVEQVLTVVDAFDQDLGMTTAAIGQMIRTGMVKDAQEGLDVLTAALQTPANKADDLMETVNEYGTQFRKLGLDGASAMGLLSQGLQGGARDSDIVADSLKELTLRTAGATTEVQKLAGGDTALRLSPLGKAFEDIGIKVLDADGNLSKIGIRFQKDLAEGGPKAKRALDQVLDGIKNIDDPAQRTADMVSLFGTQAEDMGDALLSLDLDSAAEEIGKVEGASEKAVEQMGSGSQATIDSYKRKIIDMGRGMIESTGPTAALAGAVAAFGPAVLQVVGPVATLVAARATQATAAGTAAAAETAASGAVVRGWLASAAASTAGAIRMAAAWVIAMGPIALVIAAVVGLVALVIANWDTIKEKTGQAWDWVVTHTVGAWEDFVGAVKEKGGAAVDWVKELPGKVQNAIGNAGATLKQKGKDLLQGLRDGAGEKWEAVKDWVGNTPERVFSAVGGVARTLAEKGRDLFQGLRDGAGEKWDNVVSWFQNAPERATNAVGNTLTTLKEKGKDLLQGLRDGAGEKWDNVVGWVENTGSRISTAVGDLGTLLKDAGIAIVQGLIDGIEAKFQALKDKVSGLTKWVKDHKGPKAYDLTLWRPAGNWIMEGLMNGLDDQMPALADKVGGVTDFLANAPTASLDAALTASDYVPPSNEVAQYAAAQAGGTSVVNNWEITTPDPESAAAEVSRRQGLAGASA